MYSSNAQCTTFVGILCYMDALCHALGCGIAPTCQPYLLVLLMTWLYIEEAGELGVALDGILLVVWWDGEECSFGGGNDAL